MIIAIAGKKGSGKSTAADIVQGLLHNSGYKAFRASIASKLKCVLQSYYNLSYLDFSPEMKAKDTRKYRVCEDAVHFFLSAFGVDKEPVVDKPLWIHGIRKLMQYVGTEIIRANDENAHLKHLALFQCTIIDDVRFPNEIEYLHDKARLANQPFLPLYIKRGKKKVDTHISEQLSEDGFIVVQNSGSKKDLENILDTVVQAMLYYNN